MDVAALIERAFALIDLRVVRPGLPNRIGHLVLDFESYIKERLLQGRRRRPIYVVDERAPCNRCVLDYWRDYIHVVEGRWSQRLRGLLGVPAIVDDLEHRYAYTMEGASPCFAIEAAWGERPPLFTLKPEHAARGEAALRAMGVPEGAWFVCIHARGGGYSPADETYHHYRNVAIGTYGPALDEIVARGGWCIRMGDPTMEPLPPMPRTVDYALSAHKSDWMDVFLCARCRFFLGSSSGLFLISSAFGVPSAVTNTAPMGCAYSIFRKDISIPQLFLREGRPIPFPELLASPVADLRYAQDIAEAGVTLRPNSPEEIRDLALEMLDRLQGLYAPQPGDEERQDGFRRLFHDGNYSYGSCARIGDSFLRRHEVLLRGVA